MESDRLTEAYVELRYQDDSDSSTWGCRYVGGLMLFNNFAPRNYYEHRAGVSYTGGALTVTGSLSARHDRQPFQEYDNVNVSMEGSYRWDPGGHRLAVSNLLGVRSFAYVHELNSLADETSVGLTVGARNTLEFHLTFSLGVKRFTTSSIDTMSYGVVQTTGRGNNGKGKGLGNGARKVSGTVRQEAVLVTSGSTGSMQIVPGVTLAHGWKGGELEAGFRYRFNPGSDTRLLSHVGNSSILEGDIYNDHFSYGGPEYALAVRHEFPLVLRMSVEGEYQHRSYLAPAFDLAGFQTDPDRKDLHGSVQVSATHSFPIGGDASLELTLSLSLLRNMSNDSYNDYSAAAAGVSVGANF
jgi:hypothetical protein